MSEIIPPGVFWAFLSALGILVLVFLIYATLKFSAFRAKEQTRREVMKSVADGKISADDAEKLLNAGKNDLEIKL